VEHFILLAILRAVNFENPSVATTSYLAKEVFPVKHTGNTIVDLALNYIHFATSESKLSHVPMCKESI
jgi:hypothetical protein